MAIFRASGMGMQTITPLIFVPIIFIAILIFIWLILVLVEILRAKNDNSWKILWIVVIALLNVIGLLLFMFIGRKEVKNKVNMRWIGWLILIFVVIELIVVSLTFFALGVR